MRPIQRLALLVPILILLAACNTRQETRSLTLEDLVDKRLLPMHDSLTAARDKKVRRGFFPMLHRLAKEYPYSKDSASHAMIAFDLGINYSSVAVSDSALLYMNEALPYFESHPDFQFYLCRCYNALGMALRNTQGNIFLANRYSSKAAALSLLPEVSKMLPATRRAQMFFIAANTNMLCEQMDEAVRFARLGYELVQKYQTDSINAFVHYRALFELTAAYIQTRQYDSVMKYIAIADQWVRNNEVDKGIDGVNSLKSAYYLDTKQYDSSLKYIPENGNGMLSQQCYKLHIYTMLHKPAKAAAVFNDAEQLLQSDSSFNNGDNEYYRYRTEYLIRYGDRDAALQSFLNFDSLSKEVYNKEQLNMFASIEPEYNLADKQKRLDRLDKANKAAGDELKRKNTLLLVSVLVILLVSVTVIALLALARQRKLRSEKKILESERNKIELEQRLLRTQMEPHFIFNTLSVLQSQIHNQETDKASTYLNHFARLLRTSLENSRENFVPLQEEIEALEAYLSLQQMRFEHAFDYEIQLYPGFEEDDVQILPMLLQPFVENAIQYGRGSAGRRLFIMVNVYAKDNVLYCSIENNGERVEETPARATKKSLSTQIIRERLAIVSQQTGKEARLTVHDTEILGHAGTRVTIVFPLLTDAAVQQLKDGVAV